MSAKILNGTLLAEEILVNLYQNKKVLNKVPSLAVILVGNDPASHIYVKLKEKAAKKIDINFHKYLFDEKTSETEILETIEFLNNDDEVNAILVQIPLPKHLDQNKIIATIDPKKDVDGFHPENQKKLLAGKPYIVPGLDLGIIELIKSSQKNLDKKKCTVICNTALFGESLKQTLLEYKIQTEVSNPDEYLKNTNLQKADIIIIAIGKAKWLKKEMIKDGAIIIDVGINKINGKTVGDADFLDLKEKADFISPVPGGVGPMTIACLLENTFNLALKQEK